MKNSVIRRFALIVLLGGTVALGAMPTDASAASVRARIVLPGGSEVTFRREPRWVSVPNTHVYRVRDDVRASDDVFRIDGRFYVYSLGQWFRSNRWNGRYHAINERQLPPELRRVARQYWRSYPSNWRDDRRADNRGDWRNDRRDDRRDDRRNDRWDDRRDDRRDDRCDDRQDDRRDDRRDDQRGSW